MAKLQLFEIFKFWLLACMAVVVAWQAKQHAKFSEAATPPPLVVKEFINGGACEMAAEEKLAAVNGVGLGALTNLLNSTSAAETKCF